MRLARDPAILLTLIATVVRVAAAFFFDISEDNQALINAAAAAVAGAFVAIRVKSDKQVPALLGALHAVLALAVGFGLDWSAEQQATAMSFFGALLAFYTRDRVLAPVAAEPPITDADSVVR